MLRRQALDEPGLERVGVEIILTAQGVLDIKEHLKAHEVGGHLMFRYPEGSAEAEAILKYLASSD